MVRVKVNELQPGMQLARDVLAPNGRKLMARGENLQSRHLQIFKAWGVTEADIIAEEDLLEDNHQHIPQEAWSKASKLLKPFFLLANTKKEPMGDIFQLSLKHSALAFSKGKKEKQIRQIPAYQHLKHLAAQPPEELLSIEQTMQAESQLLTLPDIFHRIVEILNSPRSSAYHVAQVVSNDISLSARLLKLVNSPFYGFNTKVDTVSRAIALLGVNKLVTLAQGIAVIRLFQDIPGDVVDMQAFWEHSTGCAVFAKLLAAQKAGLDEERFFVAGLLHDIGKLLLFKTMPRLMCRAMLLSLQKKIFLHQAEREVFQFDHAQFARQLCCKWLLPEALIDMISSHHIPEKQSRNPMESAVVHVADSLVQALGIGFSGNVFVPSIQNRLWQQLGIPTSALQTIVDQSGRQISEITNVFCSQD